MYKVFFCLSLVLFTIESCSKDPIEGFQEVVGKKNNSISKDVSPTGTYNLVAFNSYSARDLNKDEQFSINQLNETDCFDSMQINLLDATTFSAKFKEIMYAGDMLVCNETEIVGSYQVSNRTLLLNYMVEQISYQDTFYINQDTIKVAFRRGQQLDYSSKDLLVGLNQDTEFIYVRSR